MCCWFKIDFRGPVLSCALICFLVLGEAKIKFAVFASAQRAGNRFFAFALLIYLDQEKPAEMLYGMPLMMMASLSRRPTTQTFPRNSWRPGLLFGSALLTR